MKVQDDIVQSNCVWSGRQNEYRYVLRRVWDSTKPKIAFIGLNPSTADEQNDDNTVRKCINVAKRDGFGEIAMLNAFGYRSTDPSILKHNSNVTGTENDRYILAECKGASKIVCAWGRHAAGERNNTLLKLLGERSLWCFAINKDGTPKHPLYVRNDAPLIAYNP